MQSHRLVLYICVALALAPVATARGQSFSIRHSPPPRAVAGEPLDIEAIFVGDVSPERLASADVVVAMPDGGLRSIPLTPSRNALFGEVPGVLVTPPAFSYYLRVVDMDGIAVTVPPSAPEGGMLVVPVEGGRDSAFGPTTKSGPASEPGPGVPDPDWASRSVEILSPLPGEVVAEDTPQVAALFDPPLDEPWDALVLLDGADVTELSEITSELFLFSPAEPLGTGPHRLTFSALTVTGVVEASWVFFVHERTVDDRPVEDWLWTGDSAADSRRTVPSWEELEAAWTASDTTWQVAGRMEAGWVKVAAETPAIDSIDVFLPYAEVFRPSFDFYVSGVRGTGTLLVTARYDPVYSDELDWLVSGGTEKLKVEAGDVFPSLSPTTLNWAVGQGARLSARAGRSTTELVGMRMSEADTLAGFGIYSRLAAGGKQSFDWNERLSASVIYLSVFDRKESVSDEQQITEPLRNNVIAGLLRTTRGHLSSELELARSDAVGEVVGRGTAVRAKLELKRDWWNRVSLEYVSSEPDYYSAGTYEYEPGEHTLTLDYSCRPNVMFSSSGWVRTGRSFDSRSDLAENEYELKVYSRAELTWPVNEGSARTYVVARYDRSPRVTYDYTYTYAALGGTWRRGRTHILGNVSWSGVHSPDETDTWSASGDIKHELIQNRWTARVAARWTAAAGATDYTRSHYTFETRWDFGPVDVELEYWLIDREDREDPSGSYTEHVVTLDVGHTF
ncbi:MAG: hypothetical protein U9Q95_00625 [Candidatus Eisenbacteria bacterium]|nr:hypothetical protein [Candidatus Eisenbacteria bacterium]